MLALGIIMAILVLLLLVFIVFRGEIRAWQKQREARRKQVERIINPERKHP